MFDKIIDQGMSKKIYSVRIRDGRYFIDYLENNFKITTMMIEDLDKLIEWMRNYFGGDNV